MATEEKPKRKYKKKQLVRKVSELDDAHLLEKSRTWQALFVEHVAAFTAKDPNLDANFAQVWLDHINDFEDTPTDETMVDDIADKTDTLVKKISALMLVVDQFEYHARVAFPGDERMMEEFGFEQFRKQEKNKVARLVILCVVLKRLRDDYIPELTTAGLPPTWPQAMLDALDAMGIAELEQEYAKRKRIRTTTIRIRMFNNLWNIHLRIKAAAALVFSDNKIVAEQFA